MRKPSPPTNLHPAPNLRLFDAFALAGWPTQPPLFPARRPQDLLAEMDRCGVDEALVISDSQDLTSPLTANHDLLDFCAASPRLHPVWTILPSATGEMPPHDLAADMNKHNVRALHVDAGGHKFLLNGLCLGPILDMMTERRIPLILQRRKVDWNALLELLKEFPGLTVIFCGGSQWGHDRVARPMLERFERLYLDTSTYELDGGLPELVARFGPERFVFGSSYHLRAMGGPALQLRNMNIAPHAKELIAHGNIERLLRESRP
ncbi:MAG TPA: amidohydrolase family protein [Candidatus Brocadiia bacterium]|nr:amidohydrolase family protein [Candidatus Brocadiia bacterium]